MKLKFILFLILACICVSFGLWWDKTYQTRIDSSQKKPNILLISLDACRADHLSCYGYYRKTSPFIDELASRGTRFENAFINTLSTPPSHTTMFTSLYQETHCVGKYDLFSYTLPENITMLQELLQEDGYITIGVTETELFYKMGFDKGFLEFDFTEKLSDIESSTQKLLRLLKKYSDQGKPIFAFFHTYEIHSPYEPPLDYTNLFGNFKSEIKSTGLHLIKYVHAANKLKKSDIDYLEVMYDREIRYTDDTLRNLFAELDNINFFDNYAVIITSDHGEEFGDHGGLLHRGLLYDELLHVPLIIAGNLIPRGKVVKDMVSCVDIMPTILAFAGIETNIPMEGKNLFSRNYRPKNQEVMIFAQRGISRYAARTHEWKYIEYHQPDKIELFKLTSDPQEQKNVSNNYPKIRDKFMRLLSEWRDSRLKLDELRTHKIKYTEETLDKLRSLGYLE